MAHLWVNGRLSGWFSRRKDAEDMANEYRAEGKKCRITEGTMREADEIWAASRSETVRKGWATRRAKATA